MSDEELARVAYGNNDKHYSAKDKQDAVRRLSAKGLSAKSFSEEKKKNKSTKGGGASGAGGNGVPKKTQKEMIDDEEFGMNASSPMHRNGNYNKGFDSPPPENSLKSSSSTSSTTSNKSGGAPAADSSRSSRSKSPLQLRKEADLQKKADYDAKQKEKEAQMKAFGSSNTSVKAVKPAVATKAADSKKSADSYSTI
jgi:hypothetical protein